MAEYSRNQSNSMEWLQLLSFSNLQTVQKGTSEAPRAEIWPSIFKIFSDGVKDATLAGSVTYDSVMDHALAVYRTKMDMPKTIEEQAELAIRESSKTTARLLAMNTSITSEIRSTQRATESLVRYLGDIGSLPLAESNFLQQLKQGRVWIKASTFLSKSNTNFISIDLISLALNLAITKATKLIIKKKSTFDITSATPSTVEDLASYLTDTGSPAFVVKTLALEVPDSLRVDDKDIVGYYLADEANLAMGRYIPSSPTIAKNRITALAEWLTFEISVDASTSPSRTFTVVKKKPGKYVCIFVEEKGEISTSVNATEIISIFTALVSATMHPVLGVVSFTWQNVVSFINRSNDKIKSLYTRKE